MKRISCIFLLSVLITSCANLTSPKATVHPQATITHTPTFTPTITPTITLTPTETPDPNMPSDATGKDPVTGEYTKSIEENGNTVVYYWKQFQFGDNAQNGIKGYWFKSMMENGPINLTGYGENCAYWGEGFPLNMTVYAVEGQTNLEDFINSGGIIQVGDGLWSPLKGYDFYWINEDWQKTIRQCIFRYKHLERSRIFIGKYL